MQRAHDTAPQFGAPTVTGTLKEILGHINEAASMGAGKNAGEMWQTAKAKFGALKDMIGPTATSDPITSITNWVQSQLDEHADNVAKYNPNTDLGKRALAAIPVVGSTAADIISDMETGNYASAGLKAGKGLLSVEVGRRLPALKENVENVVSKAASKISPPPDVVAGTAYENVVAPGKVGAADQAALRGDWERARKYIGSETAKAPIASGEGGTMRAATTTRAAANKLWKANVEPVIDKFGAETASTSDIADRIRSTPSDIDVASKPGITKKVDRLAKVFDRQMSISEMNSKVTELNADPSVGKFYEMSGADRAKAIEADPTLHAKVSALDGLREKMFDTIADKWSDEGGQAFREARKDYGALRNVEESFRDAKVPTPGTRSQKVVKAITHPRDTAMDAINNPNRLAAKAVNTAGKTGEGIPAPPAFPAAAPIPPPPAAPAPSTSPVGTPPPLEFPGATPNAMWSGTQPSAGFDQPSQMVSSIRPPENVKGPSVTASPSAPSKTNAATKNAPTFYRSEAAPLARKYGLISREPSAPGLVSFQDATTGGSIEMKDGFTEEQLAAKVKAHRDAMSATGAEGKSDLQAAKRASATSRFAHEAAPASGQVKSEMGKLHLYDLVTPRQQTTLETMIRGPRWKDMEAVDRAAAIRAVLAGK